jgi:hypothetical protein
MLSRLRQIAAGVWIRIFVAALALVLVWVCSPPSLCAREDPPKPHIQPGDGDGPAGVQDAVLMKDHTDDVLPLWFVGECSVVEVIVINVVILKTTIAFKIVVKKP